jgi:hypothetical protein
MFYDNNNNIKMTKNHVFQFTKTKHIEYHYHFIREKVMSKKNSLHVPSIQQQADIFRKPLRRTKFEGLRQAIGVMSKSLVSLI